MKIISPILIYINMNIIKKFESYESSDTLIIVDVQRSFKKYFTEMYINQLTKYCGSFKNVYQIFDNHIDGKNVDKDYLYEEDPDVPVHSDLYTFPNSKDIVEKRYNYDVDSNFYKKILDKDVFLKISDMEEKKTLKKGDMFPTKKGTHIIYIGNNHKWHHISKKLYNLLTSLKGKSVVIVGGSDSECLEDIYICSLKLGVNIKRNWKFIYTATSCPIK